MKEIILASQNAAVDMTPDPLVKVLVVYVSSIMIISPCPRRSLPVRPPLAVVDDAAGVLLNVFF